MTAWDNVLPKAFIIGTSWDDKVGIFSKIIEVAFSTDVSDLVTISNPISRFPT